MVVEPLGLAADSWGRSPRIALPVATVAAFLGRTERGPVDEPVPVASFDEFRRVFGGHCPLGHLSYAVQHYFLHGGEAAVVVRLANRATRALVEIGAGDGELRLSACRPGGREYLRASVDYDGVENDARRFNLVVQRVARPGSELVEDQELFPSISVDPADPRFVVDALGDSDLVRVAGPVPMQRPDATRPNHPGQPIPYVGMTIPGYDGEELTDYDVVGSNEEGTGIFALDRWPRVDLVCVPAPPGRDFGTTAFLAAERYCRRRRAMLVWDPPWAWRTADAAVLGARAFGLAGRNALTYFPRLRPRAELARFPAGITACGALAGLLAAGDAAAGRPVAPTARLKASLTTLTDVGDAHAARLERFGVNPLVRVTGGGVVMAGNVCLAPQDRIATVAQRLDTRRATLYALGTLERGTAWMSRVLAEPDAPERLERQARAILAELHARGVLAGQRADEAFFVRMRRDGGSILLRAGFALRTPAEFQIYELEYGPGRTTTRELPPLDAEQLAG